MSESGGGRVTTHAISLMALSRYPANKAKGAHRLDTGRLRISHAHAVCCRRRLTMMDRTVKRVRGICRCKGWGDMYQQLSMRLHGGGPNSEAQVPAHTRPTPSPGGPHRMPASSPRAAPASLSAMWHFSPSSLDGTPRTAQASSCMHACNCNAMPRVRSLYTIRKYVPCDSLNTCLPCRGVVSAVVVTFTSQMSFLRMFDLAVSLTMCGTHHTHNRTPCSWCARWRA
jgi:hypothetical protein